MLDGITMDVSYMLYIGFLLTVMLMAAYVVSGDDDLGGGGKLA